MPSGARISSQCLAMLLLGSALVNTTAGEDTAINQAEKLHKSLSAGQCGVCIERDKNHGGAINMNFKDVWGESNWNYERFNSGKQLDCTKERISADREIRLVQFFPHVGSTHCICGIHVSCHQNVGGTERAWVNIDGDFLTRHWLHKWPGGDSTKGRCPTDCVLLSEV